MDLKDSLFIALWKSFFGRKFSLCLHYSSVCGGPGPALIFFPLSRPLTASHHMLFGPCSRSLLRTAGKSPKGGALRVRPGKDTPNGRMSDHCPFGRNEGGARRGESPHTAGGESGLIFANSSPCTFLLYIRASLWHLTFNGNW